MRNPPIVESGIIIIN